MGNKMGPSYVNLSVGFLEEQFFDQFDVLNRNFTAAISMIALAQHLVADKSSLFYHIG